MLFPLSRRSLGPHHWSRDRRRPFINPFITVKVGYFGWVSERCWRGSSSTCWPSCRCTVWTKPTTRWQWTAVALRCSSEKKNKICIKYVGRFKFHDFVPYASYWFLRSYSTTRFSTLEDGGDRVLIFGKNFIRIHSIFWKLSNNSAAVLEFDSKVFYWFFSLTAEWPDTFKRLDKPIVFIRLCRITFLRGNYVTIIWVILKR